MSPRQPVIPDHRRTVPFSTTPRTPRSGGEEVTAWESVTLGLQPEELTELVRAQAAVLDGVGDGVVSLDDNGVVRLLNSTAVGFLGVPTILGAVPTVVGDRILHLDARPVERDGRRLGSIVVVRDRTDIVALSRRLSSVSSMGSALRVQRHEFADRVQVVAGLLDAGRPGDARAFLTEPFLQAVLGAKSTEAAERGVDLGIGEDTLVLGPVVSATAAEDIATVLGNLTGNAIIAAVAAATGGRGARRPRVEVTALQDGDNLILTVAGSGQWWDGGSSEDPVVPTGDAVHGHGVRLPGVIATAGTTGGGS